MYADTVLTNLAINARSECLQTYQNTLNTTVGTRAFLSIALPDWANGFRAYPSAAARFAISEAPQAQSNATWATGGILDATAWTTKSIGTGSSRTFQLSMAATATTIVLEVF